MKTLTALILAILMALSTTAAADVCKSKADIAAQIMGVRQMGVPMADVMAVLPEGTVERIMAVEAYETPRYITKEIQERQIAKLRDKWYMLCYKVKAEKTES
jgi:hypothetical protein